MEVTQEKIEKVAQYANVDAGLAKQALEESGGHQLEAVLLLERQGWTRKPSGAAWSTGWETGAQAEEEETCAETTSGRGKTGKQAARELVDVIANLVRNFTHITIDIWRGNDLLAGIPLIICILLFLVAPYVMIPLAVIGVFFLRCRYHISGWDFGEDAINRTMDEVSDTVEEMVIPIRKRVKKELKKWKTELERQKRRDGERKS